MNDQILETKDEIAAVENGHIVEFSFVESALSDLKEKFGDVAKFDVSTASALKATKQELSELSSYRINLEKKRKELKEPILARGKLLDEEAKRIAAKLAELEDPISAKVKAEEKRLADIKAEEDRKESFRVEQHERCLADIREFPVNWIGYPLEKLRTGRASLESIDVKGFEEFQESATLYKQVALEKMDRMIETAEQAEVQAKINEENARIAAAEKAEQERVFNIKSRIFNIEKYPASLNGFGSDLLKTEKEFCLEQQLTEEIFGEFFDDAQLAFSESMKQIDCMIVAAEEKENQAKELSAARLQKQKDDEELTKLRSYAAKAEQDKTSVGFSYDPEKNSGKAYFVNNEFTPADEANFKEVFPVVDATHEEIVSSTKDLTRDEIIDIVAAYIDISRKDAEQQIINAFK